MSPAAPVRRVRSKYGATKTQIDGFTFASKAEGRRYLELKQLQAAGHISDLRLQPSYELVPAIFLDGKKQRPLRYLADFRYVDHEGRTIVEDVKGHKTREYILKRRLMKYLLGIEVKEVK